MVQKTLKIFVASALLAGSSVALAVPFNSFDPRSMAMGGAGVAVGDAGMAPFFNPALLSVTREKDHFSLDIPIIGVRAYAPSEFKDFKDGDYVKTLQNSITTYNGNQTAGNLTAVSNNISTLSTQLTTISDKPVQAEAGAGMVVGIPGKSFGGAFYATGWAAMGGEIKYRDSQTLSEFTTAVSCLSLPTPAQVTTCLSTADPTNKYVNPANTTNPVVFNPNTGLQSTVDIRGVAMGEFGLALARQFGEGEAAWGLGITPKMVKVTLYDYSVKVDSNTNNTPDGSDYTAKYSHINFDLGLAKRYNNGWRTGFVIKNVIPHTYDFKRIASGATGSAQITTGEIKLKPQARIGGSHTTSWSTVAMDLDLTTNDPAGLEKKSQYLALGAELNAWDWAQVRLGYRANLKDSARNVPSIGLGLAPFGVVHVDVSVAKSSNEIGASARLAFTF